MKRKVNLKIILTIILTLTILILGTTSSKAVLQANPTTHKNPAIRVGANWITVIRQMETVGQTMGLTETLNGLEATSNNNIDVHMMLPTEYGAISILSASGYGNQGKLQDEADVQKRTTTGNNTGVYFTGDRWELIASACNETTSKYLIWPVELIGSVNGSSSTRGWHGAGTNNRVWNTSPNAEIMWANAVGVVGGRGMHSFAYLDASADNGGGNGNPRVVWNEWTPWSAPPYSNERKRPTRGTAVVGYVD